jgi:outer membrane protein assembly factor BamB
MLETLIALTACVFVQAADGEAVDPDRQWGQWRGPLGTGVAPHGDPPLEWSETKNVRWRVSLPGEGHSTPAVWGDRVFVTTAIAIGEGRAPVPDTAPGAHDNIFPTHSQRFVALCVDRATGKILWETALHEAFPHEGGHNTGSLASASPATNGERVFAFFGSRGLYCLDTDGVVVWQRDLGQMQTKHGHGEGASPVLHEDTLVVNWDHEGQSFLVALDERTGAERWKVNRDEPTSWASPIVLEHEGMMQVVVSGTNRLRGYDLASGAVLWECGGLSHNVVASPVSGDGMVFAGSSYERQAMLAIRLDGARGDLTVSENLLWMRRRRTPYVPSPLLYEGELYFLLHYPAVLSRVDAGTGAEPNGPFRLDGIGDVYASPVAAAGRIYITDLQGMTLVLSPDAIPKPLALNQLDDAFAASAAIAGGAIFLRGEHKLYCISAE